MSFLVFHSYEFLMLRLDGNLSGKTILYKFKKLSCVASHLAFMSRTRLPCDAVRRKQVLKELKQLSSCSQRGERVVMFLHLFVPLWWRGEEPRESTYDIRFFSSNPISSPSVLRYKAIRVYKNKKISQLLSHKKLPSESKRLGENEDEGRLSRVECCENGFCRSRREISLDNSNSIWKTGICAGSIFSVYFFYLLDRIFCIKWHFYLRIRIYKTIFWGYCDDIYATSSVTLIYITSISAKSVANRFVPISSWNGFWCGIICISGAVGIEIIYGCSDSWENHEGKNSLEPFDTISMMSLITRMFHTFTKRTK